jgi:polyisoprenoid-binding protein YceI
MGTSSAAPHARQSTWNLDAAHTVAEFKVKHMMITNVKGQFTGVSGVLTHDESDITNSRVEVTIDVATINTREADRDTHLKSADFFDVEKHPTLTFHSTRVQRKGDDELTVTGDLTIRGVTRNVTLNVEGPTAPVRCHDKCD